LFFTSAATPTAKLVLPPAAAGCLIPDGGRGIVALARRRGAPDMTVGLSSLDKPLDSNIALVCQYLRGVLTGSPDVRGGAIGTTSRSLVT
jgi:hypothetical protein